MNEEKKGQVWIETVTYTLVAFILIGLVLSFAKPKIEELQDQAVIEQSIKMLKQIDSVINEVQETGVGNKRKLEISLKKGNLIINSSYDKISFDFKGRFVYSEPGQAFNEGSIQINTTELGTNYNIQMEKTYTNLNLSYFEKEEIKTISKSSTPYTILISNKGEDSEGKITIDFEIL